jgi:hypothetical protein
MKRILLLFEQYNVRQKDLVLKENISIDILKSQIDISKDTLQRLKVSIRNIKFKDHTEEIYFFKQIKPNIYADFIFYTEQLRYLIGKPNTTNPILKSYTLILAAAIALGMLIIVFLVLTSFILHKTITKFANSLSQVFVCLISLRIKKPRNPHLPFKGVGYSN